MLELLQKLWDEYELVISELDNASEDDLCQIVNSVITDTSEIKQLRIDLRNAGVKNVTINYGN